LGSYDKLKKRTEVMPKHHFDAADAQQFLNPNVFYVGACFDADSTNCQRDRFFRDHIWENGFIDYIKQNPSERTTSTDNYEKYMDSVKKGDIFAIKRLNGKAATTMRILAIGIVLGKNFDRTIRVAWVMQDLDLEVPLAFIGTISPGYELNSLPSKELVDRINKARAKFLRLNFNIKEQYY
jgi:hypothetical protein